MTRLLSNFLSVLLMIGMAGAQQSVPYWQGGGGVSPTSAGAQEKPSCIMQGSDGKCSVYAKSSDDCRNISDDGHGHTAATCTAKDGTVTEWKNGKPAPKPVARKKAKPIDLVDEICAIYPRDFPKDCPLDVPALQETRKDAPNCSMSMISGSANDGWAIGRGWDGVLCGHEPTFSTHWICADPTRILEHDGATPSKYWCRKVQP